MQNSQEIPFFKAQRKTLKYTQTINTVPDKIFPLLCPVKEADWLDSWTYKMIFSESGYAEQNCVFAIPTNGENEDTIWYISHHDKENHEIEFVYFVPGIRVTHLKIKIQFLNTSQSNVFITYIHTAVSEKGNSNLNELTDPIFIDHMKHWENAVNHYLKTGEKLRK